MNVTVQQRNPGLACGTVARPWCQQCATDKFLLIESVGPCSCRLSGVTGLGYSCLECGSFSAHCVRISEVGDALARMVEAMKR
jgi:hypothetical protein